VSVQQTVVFPLLGGISIGVAAGLFLVLAGRIAGIRGILGGLLPPKRGDTGWRLSFVLGLVACGAVVHAVMPEAFPTTSLTGTPGLVVAGLLVGVGTRAGSGCTSGHGVCGLARFSRRSFVATGVFMATGVLTVWFLRHGLGVWF